MLLERELSRREREVMQIIHRRGRATAAEVRSDMADPPTDPAVRSILRILVNKGHLEFESEGPRYVYSPTVSDRAARNSVLENVVETFFDGSAEGVMAALLERMGPLSTEQKRRLKTLIDRADREGR
ncbi:MAG: BlaI/MecI/CopY family transcriptional regulator [Gemmatimonadota bacterium]